MKLYCVKSDNQPVPINKDWKADRGQILRELLTKKGNVLYEKEESHTKDRVKSYKQYPVLKIKAIIEDGRKESYFKAILSIVNRNNGWGLFDNSVVGHGNAHGTSVAWLCNVIATIENLSVSDKVLLIIAGLFHDVGRTWNNLNDPYHGEKSFVRLAMSLKVNREDFSGIAEELNHIIALSIGVKNLLQEDDIYSLYHIIAIHSLDEIEKEKYYSNHVLSNNKRFLLLSEILDDCDALDRVRFGENLDIRFLRGDIAKRLIQYTADIQGYSKEFGNEI